jgi:hypothetical protein
METHDCLAIICLILLVITIAAIFVALWIAGGREISTRRRVGGRLAVGGGRSKSEAAAVKILEAITGREFPTVNPQWLKWRGGRPLELDGYNEELALALEFSGPLHTKWYPERESYSAYFERVVRDVFKRRACARRGVHLIVLDMTTPRRHWQHYLESRLYDLGYLTTRPADYITEQVGEPFRNASLERELDLGADMERAEGNTIEN